MVYVTFRKSEIIGVDISQLCELTAEDVVRVTKAKAVNVLEVDAEAVFWFGALQWVAPAAIGSCRGVREKKRLLALLVSECWWRKEDWCGG